MTRREELICRRIKVGHTQESLAFHLDVAPTTVSAWERGERNPGPRIRPRLAEALRIDIDELDYLLNNEVALEVNGHEVFAWLSHYESLLHAAGTIHKVELAVIPGLLQTPAYIESLERMTGLATSERRINDIVRRRLDRQHVLVRDLDPAHLTVLLAEGVLRDQVGTAMVMVDQLDHLLTLAERPNVEIRLLGPGQAPAAIGGFELLTGPTGRRPFLACTFDVGGVTYREDPDVVAKFVDRYTHLVSTSLTPQATQQRIAQIRKTHQ